MNRIPIRAFSNGKPVRLFDVLVDNGIILFQVKTGKNEYNSILLEDFLNQVEAATYSLILKQEGNYPDEPHLPS